MTLRALPIVVVRPPDVWDTRAPLHVFFGEIDEATREHSLLTLAVARTRYEAEHLPPGTGRSAANFMRARISGPVASKAWNGYRDWWRRARGNAKGQPTIKDVEKDLAVALYPIRERSVVKIAAIFETFVQCWALNTLLATVEDSGSLEEREELLAEDLSPVHSSSVTPGVPKILEKFPGMKSRLLQLSLIRTDPVTGKELEESTKPELNSYLAINFWRAYRNVIVHSDGLLSASFCERHAEFFESMREPYGVKLKPLEPMSHLQLISEVFYDMVSVHNRAALFLNEGLKELSSRTRGTIHLPDSGLEEPVQSDPTLKAQPLLVDGDHENSLRWIRDETFRGNLLPVITAARLAELSDRKNSSPPRSRLPMRQFAQSDA